MKLFLIWLSLHVGWLFLAVGGAMWIASVVLYFRPNMRRRQWLAKRHSWSVDIGRRQAFRSGKVEKSQF